MSAYWFIGQLTSLMMKESYAVPQAGDPLVTSGYSSWAYWDRDSHVEFPVPRTVRYEFTNSKSFETLI